MQYLPVYQSWPPCGYVEVHDSKGLGLLARFPIDFLKLSGDNTWAYIIRVIRHIVDEENFNITHLDSQAILPDEVPQAGKYQVKYTGT